MIKKDKTFLELIFVTIIFFVFLIILSPSGLGEYFTEETWKSWGASRILLSKGEFVQNSLGPLYYLFLIILSPFDYKNSIIIEYFFTHIFFMVCVYFLFLKFDKKFLGVLFSIFLITYIAFIQSPKYVLAPGFLILHFANHRKSYFGQWFPPFLFISFLCNWGYVVFFIGHLLGKFFFHFKNKNLQLAKPNLITIILSIILICPIILKADKFYNNHFVSFYDLKYSPIALKSPLEIGFFQIGNYKKARNDYAAEDLYKADWYLTHNNFYGDCKTLTCILKNKPKIIVEEIFNDPGYNLRILTSLIFNKEVVVLKKVYFIPFLLLFALIVLVGSFNILRKNRDNYILIFCLFLGTLGYLLALSLTTFSYRYSFPLFPVFIILLLNANIKIPNISKKYANTNFFLVFVLLIQLIFNVKDYIIKFDNKEFYKTRDIEVTKKKTTNYFKSEKSVFKYINSNQKILTTDPNWLRGFSQADPKKIYSQYALPPVDNEDTSKFLNTFDIILLKYNVEIAEPSIGTQSYLRYKLHLKDYLIASKDKWLRKEIKNYGNIYIKKN